MTKPNGDISRMIVRPGHVKLGKSCGQRVGKRHFIGGCAANVTVPLSPLGETGEGANIRETAPLPLSPEAPRGEGRMASL